MSFLSDNELKKFKFVGENVKLSSNATFYHPETIEIGDNSRIDDFCVLSGKIKIGKNVHIATHNILAGGESGLKIGDYVGIAAKCHIFCKSDDYKGGYFNGPTVNKKYTNQLDKSINVKKHVLIGTNVLVLPGTLIGEGSSVYLNSVAKGELEDWSIFSGNPIRKVGERDKALKALELEFIKESGG